MGACEANASTALDGWNATQSMTRTSPLTMSPADAGDADAEADVDGDSDDVLVLSVECVMFSLSEAGEEEGAAEAAAVAASATGGACACASATRSRQSRVVRKETCSVRVSNTCRRPSPEPTTTNDEQGVAASGTRDGSASPDVPRGLDVSHARPHSSPSNLPAIGTSQQLCFCLVMMCLYVVLNTQILFYTVINW